MNPPTTPSQNPEEVATDRHQIVARRLANLLESARQQSGTSIEQVQSELRIPGVALGHLRSGEFDALGPDIYAHGFVLGYARIVNAPLAEVASLWAQLHETPSEVPLVSHVPQRPGWHAGVQRAATVAIVLGVLVGPVLWLHSQGAFQQWFGSDVEVSVVSGDSGPAADSSTPTETAPLESAPVLEVPDDPDDPAAGPVAASIASLPGTEFATTDSEVVPAAFTPLVLEIYFRDDCWVEVSNAEGDPLEYDLVRANSRRRYESQGPLLVFLGNADAVTVAVNGEFLDIAPYRRRNMARFEVDVPKPEKAE